MSTIHDKKAQVQNSRGTETPNNAPMQVLEESAPLEYVLDEPVSEPELSNQNNIELAKYQAQAVSALSLVDDVVLKTYLAHLSEMEVAEMPWISNEGIILFKINRMVYEKDEYAIDKLVSAISAMTYTNCSVFLIVDGHLNRTDFYLGIKGEDIHRGASSIAETFRNAIYGQFPGIQMEKLSDIEKGAKVAKQDIIINRLKDAKNISSCVCIPSIKDANQERTNMGFVQGIEKLALAMREKEYTAIILAQNSSIEETQKIRIGFENLYSQLSTQATQQLAYSANESLANAFSRTKGVSDSETHGTSTTHTEGETHTEGTSTTKGQSKGTSENNFWGKAGKAAAPLMEAGAFLTAFCPPAGLAMMGTGALLGVGGIVGAKTKNNSEFTSEGQNVSDARNISDSKTDNNSNTHQESFSETNGQTATIGSSKNFTLTIHNKHIEELLKRIDRQLQRIEQAESTGLWQTGAYFLSYDNDRATAEIAATIFKSIMQGESSGIETSAINSWYLDDSVANNQRSLPATISSFTHPIFSYKDNAVGTDIPVIGATLINSSELAMMVGLPRKSVPGLPVVEYASLAKEVVSYLDKKQTGLTLGCVYDYGTEFPLNKVALRQKSLTQHVFVTGSTGCGKSETVYKLIAETRSLGTKFLVIEPAKGEYKDVFGNVAVYGTNPTLNRLLRINPFRFPTGKKGIHVLEHIDRLVEIFNVCWPMYAAMPAVLKKAVLKCYEKCGWDMVKSINKYDSGLFPTFSDLLQELESTIKESAYSEEVKSNYIGSLVTRVESLTNGINGEIFASTDLDDKVLFDENAIIDLSRVGSQETKSLIMGILIMRLSEYRMTTTNGANRDLSHVTILEEAHNILKRTSTEQSMEGSNVTGKSVEMLTTAIAEMRTYGEGFIIVDQSPTSVSPAAIKNTNTKIIMRLPDGDDRKIAGKAASMKDNQIDEIAKLPTGVAVVYQNDWVEPVLCKIDMFTGERIPYQMTNEIQRFDNSKAVFAEILKLLLKGRCPNDVIELDIPFIIRNLSTLKVPSSTKIKIAQIAKDISDNNFEIWEDANFVELSSIVTGLLNAQSNVENLVKKSNNFKELDKSLDRFVCEKASIQENLNLVVRQCLMRQYAERDETSRKIYDAWYNTIKNQILL